MASSSSSPSAPRDHALRSHPGPTPARHAAHRSLSSAAASASASASASRDDNTPRSVMTSTRLEHLSAAFDADRFSHDALPGIFPDQAGAAAAYHHPSAASTSSTARSRPLVLRAHSNDDYAYARPPNRASARLRTMTLESVSRSATPQQPQWVRAGRGRVASVNDFTRVQPAEPASQPNPSSLRTASSTQPLDAFPETPDHRPHMAAALSASHREASPSAKAKHDASVPTSFQMLQLMKSTRGKLEGHLIHRGVHSKVWRTSFCAIDPESGSLMGEAVHDDGAREHRILVRDLRGCIFKAAYDFEARAPVIEIYTADNTPLLKARPKSKNMFNAWFAALLCWHPVLAGQHVRRLSRRPSLAPLGWLCDKDGGEYRPKSRDEAAVIKVGTMKAGTQLDVMMIEPDEQRPGTAVPSSSNLHPSEATSRRQALGTSAATPSPVAKWSNISCTLRENGEFTLFTKRDNHTLAVIQLSQLSRCAVQRLHPSVMDVDCCIVIYPQYARSIDACSRLRPIFLSFDSKVLFEAWFVLLRAFTIPELYGPQRSKSTDSIHSPEVLPGLSPELLPSLLRIERSISLKLSSARLRLHPSAHTQPPASSHKPLHQYRDTRRPGTFYAEILLDGQRKAKSAKVNADPDSPEPIWIENFELDDLPSSISLITVRVKEIEEHVARTHSSGLREAASQEFSVSLPEPDEPTISGIAEILRGEAVINTTEFENARATEKWWPLHSESGEHVGDVLLMVRIEQDSILMEKEFEPLSNMLHHFTNGLTINMAEKLPEEPARLAQILLDIFQTTGKAGEWIMYLAEEEIDGILKERPETRSRFGRRLDSNEALERPSAYENAEDRLHMVNESLQKARTEVSTLFRGNTILTRSLDAHMKRLGKEYLEDTIGGELRKIAENDLQCEVDPSRPGYSANNWPRLIEITQRISDLIFTSADRCPSELRVIFRHIRSFAVDKYGDFRRSVAYTSVSSFLFLRFFVAAILHPKAFGLINYQPRPHVLRTHTLVAKGLGTLANLSVLGPREPYMEGMNAYINSNRTRFKEFIDAVCAVPSSPPLPLTTISPSYSTPLQIYSRLPPASREGFLSLPFLLDRGRAIARLVNHWLDYYTPRPPATDPDGHPEPLDADLQRFADLCLNLRHKTILCFESADRRERRSSGLSQKWVELAERMEESPGDFWVRRNKPKSTSPAATRSADPLTTTTTSAAVAIPVSTPSKKSPPPLSGHSHSLPLEAPRPSSRSAFRTLTGVTRSPRTAPRPDNSLPTPPAVTSLSRSAVLDRDEFDPLDPAGAAIGVGVMMEPISRTASPLGLGGHISAGESSDGEGVGVGEKGGQSSSSFSRHKRGKKDGWGLFGRKKKEKEKLGARKGVSGDEEE